MLTFAAFLQWLTSLLGGDHALVTALTTAEAAADTDDERWAHVDDTTLDNLRAELRTAAQNDDVDVQTLGDIADRLDEVNALVELREATAAEEAAAREALLARIGGDTDDATRSTDDADGEPDTEPVDEVEPAATDTQPEPVAAAAPPVRQPSLARTAARRPHATAPAPAEPEQPQVSVQLADTIGDFGRGAELSVSEFADAVMRATRENRGGYRGAPTKLRLGTIRHELPEHRQLTGNVALNSQRVGELQRQAREQMASADDNAAAMAALVAPLTASGGGLCAPTTPYYPVQTLGDDLRGVADFVMSMQADRGGINFVPPPSFVSGWGADLADGVSEFTVEDDADPDFAGKPCAVLDCDEPVTVVIEAIVKCLEVTNIRAMTYREQVEAALHYLSMFHARTSETALIVGTVDRPGIERLCDDTVTFTGPLGASRELVRSAGVAATALRDQFRMSSSEVLDYLLPHWVPAAMALDVAAALTGTTTDEALAFSEAAVGRAFGRYNLRVGYFRDTQNFTADDTFPSTASGYLFPPGTFMHLTDPELDLGLVRDSALNSRNVARYFAETFEAIAKVGVVAREVTTDVCLNGAQSGTLDPADVDCLSAS